MVYLYTFLTVLVISLISLIGIFLLSRQDVFLKKSLYLFISLAVGALLGDAFLHLIPEAFEEVENASVVSLLVIGGILAFFVLEKFLHWHHHGEDVADEQHIHPVGKLILFSDGVHNFLDGVIIAASFMVSIPVGIATSIAVMLHEIPQEVGDFAVLIHSGYTRARALLLNFFSALTALLGAGFFFLLGEAAEKLALYFVPLAAGGFIYIAVADLIPELHKTKRFGHSLAQIIAVGLGVFLMYLLLFLE